MPSLHAVVRGRVQGVGFRYFVLRRAVALALTGFVRNLEDGAVEVWAEGRAVALETLLSDLRAGPIGSRVSGVEADRGEVERGYEGFDVR